MKDKEKYKGIKFLKVEQQFLNVKKIKNKSTKNLCINQDFSLFNQNSPRGSAKSSAKKSVKSSAKKSVKSSIKDDISVNKIDKSKKKNYKYSDLEMIKKLLELQKQEEKIIQENKKNNNEYSNKLIIKKNLSSKSLKQLTKKLISFKSLFNNNDKKNMESNINQKKSNNNIVKNITNKKHKRFLCCL